MKTMDTTESKATGVTREGFAYHLEGDTAVLHDGTRVKFRGERILKRVVIEQENTLSGGVISWGGHVNILFNDFQVYRMEYGRLSMSLFTRIASTVRRVENLPDVDWTSRESILSTVVGRKVYYLQQPGEILEFDGVKGQVQIEAEDNRGFNLPPWEGEGNQFVRRQWVDILSHEIHWRR